MNKKTKGAAAMVLLAAVVAVSVPAIVSANKTNHSERPSAPVVAHGNPVVHPVQNNSAAQNEPISYENTQYGFRFALPDSWKGYTIVTSKWEGHDAKDGAIVESGASISIRHPEWTEEKPRQDIPIYVFTLDQWNALQQEEFFIGAAPIGPKELTRNDKYVFALPARYNFAFPDGYEEVEDILNGNPIQPSSESSQASYFGDWVVKGVAGSGEVSTLPDDKLIGTKATYTSDKAIYGTDEILKPSYKEEEIAVDKLISEFRVQPKDLGIDSDSVKAITIGDETGPGTYLLVKDENTLLFPWDGNFYEMQRAS